MCVECMPSGSQLALAGVAVPAWTGAVLQLLQFGRPENQQGIVDRIARAVVASVPNQAASGQLICLDPPPDVLEYLAAAGGASGLLGWVVTFVSTVCRRRHVVRRRRRPRSSVDSRQGSDLQSWRYRGGEVSSGSCPTSRETDHPARALGDVTTWYGRPTGTYTRWF